MISWITVVFWTLGSCAASDLSFPPGFHFGVATSAYQVEGAWNVSDKSPSVLDTFVHETPDAIDDGSTGDVACDSYHLWERDIEMIKEVGAQFYRFSISWTRLLPTSFPNEISATGAKYYNDLIDRLLKEGIEPVVTILHFDLPQRILNLGGWANPLTADWFAAYARVVFSLFGDRVKIWITINEPALVCDLTYGGQFIPNITDPEVGAYICNKNVLLAHAKAWRVYDKDFRKRQQGKVSIANQLIWFEPNTPQDTELAELAKQNLAGRYSHPIYSKEGGWPSSIERVLAEKSRCQGYPWPGLPPFTPEERELVQGTFDYYALNYYLTMVISPAEPGQVLGPWPFKGAPDLRAQLTASKSPSEGFRKQLAWLKQQYGDIEVIVTENGTPTAEGLNDTARIDYYRAFMEQMLLAIKEDGVNVTGHIAWALMDNFEFISGYTSRFGLYEVDFDSPELTRTPRASAKFYSSVIKANSLNVECVNE